MNRLAHWMMRLYPARWRQRYGEELDALLADTGADARIVVDLMRGGMRMQFLTSSFIKAAVGLGLTGVMLAGMGSFLIPSEYVSHATVQVQHPEDVISRVEPLVLTRTTLAQIINDRELELFKQDQKTQPLEEVIENMRSRIGIHPVLLPGATPASALEITFEYPDARKAQQTVAALIERFRTGSGLVQDMQQKAPAGANVLEVIDTPNLPGGPVHSNIWIIVLSGAVLGVSAAFGWRRRRNRPYATWGFAVSAIAMGLLGVMGAAVLGEFDRLQARPHLVRDLYRSTAMMSALNFTQEQAEALFTQALSRDSLSRAINDPRLLLYPDDLRNKPIEDVLRNMRAHLSITPSDRNVHYFSIAFEYPDRFKAQQTIQYVMSILDEANLEASLRLSHATLPGAPTEPVRWGKLSVFEPPSLDPAPVWPNRLVIAAMGGGAGVLLAAVIALLRNRWKPEDEIPIDAVNG